MKTLVAMLALSASVVAGGFQTTVPGQTLGPDAMLSSGVVSGIVTTGAPGRQPEPRAVVMIAGTDVGLVRVTSANAAGRFVFTGLPAGHFLLAASKAGTIASMYGAARIGRPGQTLTLAHGQQMRDLTIALARGAVVAGVVTDDRGQPVTSARVRVLPRRVIGDEIALGADAGSTAPAATDDRGAFRIFDIPPGEYVVAVQPRITFGGFVAGAGPSGDGPAIGHAPVYYPSASTAAAATPIVLSEGDVRTGVDVRTTLVRLARVEGTIEGGPVRAAQITLHPRGWTTTGTALTLFSAGTAPDGRRFTFGAVPPGEYTLQARTLPPTVPPDSVGGSQPPPFGAQWAMRDLTVSGTNLTNVTLAWQDALSVTGRVVIEGTSRLPDDLIVRVNLRATPASGVPGVPETQTADAKGAFTFTRLLPGKYRLSAQVAAIDVNAPPDWIAKSAMFNGVDALDAAVEITPDTAGSPVVLTLTDQMQEVTGVVRDAAGRPRRDVVVVVFPVERGQWFPQSRRIAVRQSHAGGDFVFGEATGLPPGDYYAAVTTDLGPGEQFDPAVLAYLAHTAQRFTLPPDGSTSLTLVLNQRPPG